MQKKIRKESQTQKYRCFHVVRSKSAQEASLRKEYMLFRKQQAVIKRKRMSFKRAKLDEMQKQMR